MHDSRDGKTRERVEAEKGEVGRKQTAVLQTTLPSPDLYMELLLAPALSSILSKREEEQEAVPQIKLAKEQPTVPRT